MIQAIIFDVDGVLLDSFEANLKFFQDLMVAAGYHAPTREEYWPIQHYSMWDTIKVFIKDRSEVEIGRIWELGREFPFYFDLLKMPPDVPEIVAELSRGYRLGVVTNRTADSIEEFFVFSKLRKYFSAAVGYEDTERHKPDPEPLSLCLKKLRVESALAVYIGDAPTDIQAGKAADMKVISYGPKSLAGVDGHFGAFKDLPNLITTL